MKNLTTQLRLASLLTLILLAWTAAYGQLTPIGDSYTNTAAATTNYGAKTVLDVESSQTSFIQFNLSSIPASYTSADITKATLKLYVNAVTTAGSFNVDYVNGTWTEGTIDASNAPALGTTIAASVPLTTASKNQYILIDITPAVQAWLSGTPNDGIALVANSPLNASFDSKESTTTSHAAELDIVFAGGGSGITGITTASGSGLTGGGTSGTLNLSLTNSCAANQVLQYNGSAWVCAAVGTGTITGVIAGTDLTGGGASGNVTLSLNTTATNALYAQLGAANTFTTNQTLNGTLTANSSTNSVIGNSTGANSPAVVGSGNGDGVLGSASSTSGTGVQGYASATTGTTVGVYGSTVSPSGTGVQGFAGATTGSAVGVYGASASPGGYGVYGGNQATTGNATGVFGYTQSSGGDGVFGVNYATTAGPATGVEGQSNSTTGQGVEGYATSTTGATSGVAGYAQSPTGYGIFGYNSATTGKAVGVFGSTAAVSGYGVYGTGAVGVYGADTESGGIAIYGNDSGEGYGVYGAGNFGVYGAGISTGVSGSSGVIGVEGGSDFIGTYGISGVGSATGQDYVGVNTSLKGLGVWGDVGGAAGTNTAVVGTADENYAAAFINNGSSYTTLFAQNNAVSASNALTFQTYGGHFGGTCSIDVSGNLKCSGTVADAVPVESGARKVALYSMQSPENWFEDFGSGALSNGAVTIALDPAFIQTVNTGTEYHVFLTPNGDSKGLYVSQKSATSFEVREQGGGTSNVAFDYRIVAKRVGYEKVRLEDLTAQFKQQEAQRQQVQDPARRTAMQSALKLLKPPVRPSAAPRPELVMPKLPPAPPIRAAVRPVFVSPGKQ